MPDGASSCHLNVSLNKGLDAKIENWFTFREAHVGYQGQLSGTAHGSPCGDHQAKTLPNQIGRQYQEPRDPVA